MKMKTRPRCEVHCMIYGGFHENINHKRWTLFPWLHAICLLSRDLDTLQLRIQYLEVSEENYLNLKMNPISEEVMNCPLSSKDDTVE